MQPLQSLPGAGIGQRSQGLECFIEVCCAAEVSPDNPDHLLLPEESQGTVQALLAVDVKDQFLQAGPEFRLCLGLVEVAIAVEACQQVRFCLEQLQDVFAARKRGFQLTQESFRWRRGVIQLLGPVIDQAADPR